MYGLKGEGKEIPVLIHAENVESGVYNQINNIKFHPFIKAPIAIMPDCHKGYGVPIGTTLRFKDAVIPNIVGVDIGCGVLSYKLPRSIELNLPEIYDFIESNIPAKHLSHSKPLKAPSSVFKKVLNDCDILAKKLKLPANPLLQAGTLGGGNHFIELEKSDKTGDVYITIHSGSRKFGLEVATYHTNKAKNLMKALGISVPKDLEYLPMELGGNEYLIDMYLAQHYANANRYMMLLPILKFIDVEFIQDNVIHSIHNYISPRDDIVRKGAISAHVDEDVVIPLNMGKDGGIILGKGLGNKSYNYSAPHGAGRVKGRAALKRELNAGAISLEMFKDSMGGIYTKTVTNKYIDEAPLAYKPLSQIEKYLKETIKIVDHAKPILAFK